MIQPGKGHGQAAQQVRVLVVDDSVVFRKIARILIDSDPALEVVGVAADGRIALAKIAQVTPDLVTLDVDMPGMDGLETLRMIRRDYPDVHVIMLSALTARGAVATLDALYLGACDYVTKPSQMGSAEAALDHLRASLIPMIKSICSVHEEIRPASAPPSSVPAPPPRRPLKPARIDAVVIGVSTGGPQALSQILPLLPADFPAPVLVVQHMPPVFTRHLADRLNQTCVLTVKEAEGGAPVAAGQVWIAQGGLHMSVTGAHPSVELEVHETAPENSCRPAADVLFRSAASVYGRHLLAVVLTGMGKDGLRGSESVLAAGGQAIVQDQATCVVGSMPGNVVQAGLASEVLPLDEIAGAIISRVGRRRTSPSVLHG